MNEAINLLLLLNLFFPGLTFYDGRRYILVEIS
jgi:hypothetical protein